MNRAPWICPACGIGCAPHVDSCPACAMKALTKPADGAVKFTPPAPLLPIVPWLEPTPWQPPAIHPCPGLPWPGTGIWYGSSDNTRCGTYALTYRAK